VQHWFGDDFGELHPNLQQLHTTGGELRGTVNIGYGDGIAGIVGRRLGRKLGLPEAKQSIPLTVTISHHDEYLLWSRKFGDAHKMESKFRPVGNYPDGYWLEETGNIEIALGVDIDDGGWCWQQRTTKVRGIKIPKFILPRINAGKTIHSDKYKFHVRVDHPWLGHLLSYHGLLTAD